MAGQGNPELYRVLATLNSYVPHSNTPPNGQSAGAVTGDFYGTTNQPSQPPMGSNVSSVNLGSSIPGLGFFAEPVNQVKPITPPPVLLHQTQASLQESQRSTATPPDSRRLTITPAVPDASTIITWPAALKHVTKYLVPDEKAATRIKHLIAEQHKHERQWWAGREAVVARQEGRTGTSQQVAALLQSIGGKAMPAAPSDPKLNAAELAMYDKKVFAGLSALAADFDRQLKNLGIPFYSIRHELVVLEQGPQKAGSSKGRIDKGELRELQKRMLQTLEDLFAD
ncbi:uncharacterized protein A1O9_04618 [Exophiala aquamarina CBS 119918]|uniref:Uncharacterized protein n=1 Tax=Exophiala aquamarina CBS 119918 TaxID=1182545 RepID=A0A072PW52_9EURO|nr:uncharacterized protein A1O9_04618 [Exophiala aquamarina CBS 119918]KEF59770.1 hypothetical protein A1O9_04618 [Exophiala aquamarina CBS 119918]